MAVAGSPLEEGDRVDHKIFGLGTVSDAPTAMVGPDMGHPSGLRDAGWSIPVKWDDPSRTAGAVMHHALRKVASPDSRPFSFWSQQWQPLLQAWIAARRETEQTLSSFRPTPDPVSVVSLKDNEQRAFEAMQRFLDDENSGKHA
ncbi:MAG: hypothetical protein EKK47_04535 [Burkholderiales bacterium]|jgi:hypothetical protein|nr:MAG: hypothetical protein EKK47_04535 [Burkholderiales bacterium]